MRRAGEGSGLDAGYDTAEIDRVVAKIAGDALTFTNWVEIAKIRAAKGSANVRQMESWVTPQASEGWREEKAARDARVVAELELEAASIGGPASGEAIAAGSDK